MSDAVVRFQSVSKHYRLGTPQRSLREVLVTWPRRLLRRDDGRANVRSIRALDDVSFEMGRGEALGIIGPNGSGKTTTLKLLAGVTRPSSGQIDVRGSVSALIELGAGFHPDLTGRENIYLNGVILGLRRKEIDALFDDIVAFAELEPFIDTPVKRYSSGMYVRLGFSVAAHVQPDILLVDEVLSVGDLSFRYKCQERMRALRQAGTTLVFVSHSLEAVQGVCDNVIFLLHGEVQDHGPAADVVKRYANWINERELDRIASALPARETEGKGLVHLECARLLTADGQTTNRFSFGHEIRVQVELTAKERIAKPLFNIILLRSDGLRCCVARSSELSIDCLEGNYIVEVRFSSLRLNGGAYDVVFAVTDDSLMAFFYEYIASFVVVDSPLGNIDPRWGGVYVPPSEWHCRAGQNGQVKQTTNAPGIQS